MNNAASPSRPFDAHHILTEVKQATFVDCYQEHFVRVQYDRLGECSSEKSCCRQWWLLTTFLPRTTLTQTIRPHYTLNLWFLGKQLVLFSRETIHQVLCYISKLSLNNNMAKTNKRAVVSARGQQVRNCIPVRIHLNFIRGT